MSREELEQSELRSRREIRRLVKESMPEAQAGFNVEDADSYVKAFDGVKADLSSHLRAFEDVNSELLEELRGAGEGGNQDDMGRLMFSECQMQVEKQAKSGGPTSIRWPQPILNLFAQIYARSSVDYEYLKKLGFCRMPSGRLMRNYTQRESRTLGVDVGKILRTVQELEKHLRSTGSLYSIEDVSSISFALDEMKIAENYVYSKSGNIFGVPLRYPVLKNYDILDTYPIPSSQSLASHMCSSVARCLGTNFSFPLGAWSVADGLDGSKLYTIQSDAHTALMFCGLRGLVSVGDGISANKKCAYGLFQGKNCVGGTEVLVTQDMTHVFKRLAARFFGSGRHCLQVYVNGKWADVHVDHVKFLLRNDCAQTESRSGYQRLRFTESHLEPTNMEKMRPATGLRIINKDVINYLTEYDGKRNAGTIYYFELVLEYWELTKFVVRAREFDEFELKCAEIIRKWSQLRVQATEDNKRFQPCFYEVMSDVVQSVKDVLKAMKLWMMKVNSHRATAYLPVSVLLQDDTERFFGFQRNASGSTNNPDARQFLFMMDVAPMRQDRSNPSFLNLQTRHSTVFSYKLPSLGQDLLKISNRGGLLQAAQGVMNSMREIFEEMQPTAIQTKLLKNLCSVLSVDTTCHQLLYEVFDDVRTAGEVYEAVHKFHRHVTTPKFVSKCNRIIDNICTTEVDSCMWRSAAACVAIFFQCAFRAQLPVVVSSHSNPLRPVAAYRKEMPVMYHVACSFVCKHLNHCRRHEESASRTNLQVYWAERYKWTQKYFLVARKEADKIPFAALSFSRESFGGYLFITKEAAQLFFGINEMLDSLGVNEEKLLGASDLTSIIRKVADDWPMTFAGPIQKFSYAMGLDSRFLQPKALGGDAIAYFIKKCLWVKLGEAARFRKERVHPGRLKNLHIVGAATQVECVALAHEAAKRGCKERNKPLHVKLDGGTMNPLRNRLEFSAWVSDYLPSLPPAIRRSLVTQLLKHVLQGTPPDVFKLDRISTKDSMRNMMGCVNLVIRDESKYEMLVMYCGSLAIPLSQELRSLKAPSPTSSATEQLAQCSISHSPALSPAITATTSTSDAATTVTTNVEGMTFQTSNRHH